MSIDNGKVLICDDSILARKQIKDVIAMVGSPTIFEASNGESAIQIYKEEKPDLVFLDIVMPKKDGLFFLEEMKNSIKTCAFTGHRNLEEDFSPRTLKKAIKACIERGVYTFLCGMAMGFDLKAASCVLEMKKKYKQIKLIACIPCNHQEKAYTEADKKTYAKLYKKADERVLLGEEYTRDCMLKRNRYMADRADVLIAYVKRNTGGSAYTVRYFQKNYPLFFVQIAKKMV